MIAVLWRLALVAPLLGAGWLRSSDALIHQQLMQWRGVRPIPNSLVLVGIDEVSINPSLSDFGNWPWPRALQAKLARAALELGAKRVILNIVHSGVSGYGAEDDLSFQETLKPWSSQVVLSASLVIQQLDDLEQIELRRPDHPGHPIGLSSFVLNPFGLVEANPGLHSLEHLLEPFPQPHPRPLANLAAGIPSLSRDEGIDFLGPAGHIPIIPAWQVADRPADTWKDRIVIIGATAPSLGDQLETPFGQLSGSEVLYSAVAGLLEQRSFQSLMLPAWAMLAMAWFLLSHASLATSGSATISLRRVLLLTMLAAGLSIGAWCWGWWIPATALILGPLLGGGTRMTAQFIDETRQRRFLHSVLSRRVSPSLMTNMVQSEAGIWTQLGGRRSSCVVLFTDLVGFTARSNDMEPEALFSLLNRYFTAMAEPVLAEDGLLDKFIGDSLMAEFGVPRHRGDRLEALAAARAALAMCRNLDALNQDLNSEGLAPLQQGIGLHFGEVIAGNLGSSHRLEYTVIGASVNLASRLESLTRHLPGHSILMSQELRELLGEDAIVENLGEHTVKGWPKPVVVYSLQGLKNSRRA